jgi:hypothetical protein
VHRGKKKPSVLRGGAGGVAKRESVGAVGERRSEQRVFYRRVSGRGRCSLGRADCELRSALPGHLRLAVRRGQVGWNLDLRAVGSPFNPQHPSLTIDVQVNHVAIVAESPAGPKSGYR